MKCPSQSRVAFRYLQARSQYPRLALYDFDGTLFRSWDKTPKWWSGSVLDTGPYSFSNLPESIDEPCVPDRPGSNYWISKTVSAAQKDSSDPQTLVALVTGRGVVHEPRIRQLLSQKGIQPDAYYFNPAMNAATFKSGVIRNLLRAYPSVVAVDIYENENISTYRKVVQDIAKQTKRDIRVVTHPVDVPAFPLACGPEDFGLSQ